MDKDNIKEQVTLLLRKPAYVLGTYFNISLI